MRRSCDIAEEQETHRQTGPPAQLDLRLHHRSLSSAVCHVALTTARTLRTSSGTKGTSATLRRTAAQTRKVKKGFMVSWAMQFETKAQWWSKLGRQVAQSAQCRVRRDCHAPSHESR